MAITKEKVRSFPWFRTVKAQMLERYIFNYRMPPAELKKRLPAPWLEPQVINGSSAVSFCILWLDRLTVSPIPPLIRFSTISCAYRIGVLDASVDPPEPSVYVTDRWADLPLISILGPLILHDTIPVIKAAIGHQQNGETHVQCPIPTALRCSPHLSVRSRTDRWALRSSVRSTSSPPLSRRASRATARRSTPES